MSELINKFHYCQGLYSPSNSILLLEFLDKLNDNEVTEVNTYVQEIYLKSTDNNIKASYVYYLLSIDLLRNKTLQRIVGLIGNLKYNYTSKKYEYAVITESDYTFYFNQLTEEEYKKVITHNILWFLPENGKGLVALSKLLSLDEKKKFREIYVKQCNSYDVNIPINKSFIYSDRTYLIKEKILEDTSLQKNYESTLTEYKQIALNDSTSDTEFSNFFNQLNPRESAILSGPFGYYHSGKKLVTFLSLLNKQKLEKLDIINREGNLGPFSRIRQIIFDLVFQGFETYHQQLATNKYNNSYFTKYSSNNYDYERPSDFLSKLVPLNLIKSPLLSQYLHLVYEEEDKHHLFVFLKQLAERDKNIILHFIAIFDRKREFDLTRIFFDKGDIPCDELVGRDPNYPSFEREKHLFYPLLADEAMIYKMLPLYTPKWYQTELSKGIKDGCLNAQELQRLDKAGLYKVSNSDLILDTFEKVFINNEDIIPFLQKLKAKDKKTLKPYIVNSSWFEDLIKKGVVSNEENNIKKGAVFAFFLNRNEIDKLDYKAYQGFIEGLKLCLENIPNFYPKWINEYFIDHAGAYDGLISLEDYIYFSENELLNIDLHPHIAVFITVDYKRYENDNRYKNLNKEDSKNLYLEEYFDHEDTKNLYLEKYFWLVFEYSPLNNHYGISFVKEFINTFINHKTFDRSRFLYETLLAIGKGFSRESTKMFYDLFMTLNPSKEELVSLQEELLEVFIELNSNKKLQKIFSPLVEEIIADENFDKELFFDSLPFLRQRDLDKALELIIKVVQHHNKDIDKANFLEHAPMLLKRMPAASIDLATNFVQTHKETLSQEDLVNLCLLVTEVLGLPKKSIHKKAATFIAENAPNQNEQVGESVKKYADNISAPCKKLLKAFFTKEEITKKNIKLYNYKQVEEDLLRHPLDEKNKLNDTGDTFDDLLLKVNDALVSSEVHNYVMKLNTLINENNVERLIPILQESFRNLKLEQNYSYRTYTTLLVIESGYIVAKRMYRYALNYWGSLLLEKYPQKLEKYKSFIEEQRVRINKEVSDIKVDFHKKRELLMYLEPANRCKTQKERAQYIMDNFSLKSFYAERNLLKEEFNYENEVIKINDFFTEEAIVRRESVQNKKNLEDVNNFFAGTSVQGYNKIKLNSYLETLKSIVDKNLNLELLSTPTHKGGWIDPKVLINRILAFEEANIPINIFDFGNAIVNTPMQLEDSSKIERVDALQHQEIKQVLQYHFGLLKLENVHIKTPDLWEPSIAGYNIKSEIQDLEDKTGYKFGVRNTECDMYALNLPLEYIFDSRYIYTSVGSNYKDIYRSIHSGHNFIERIYKQKLLPSFYTYFSKRILSADKKKRLPDFALKVWKKLVALGNWDSVLLGEALAKQAITGFILRFVENVNNDMIDVTEAHNKEIFRTINTMIAHMDEKPKKGVKELLQILNKLQSRFPGESILEESKAKLSIWKETKTLKGTINKIEKLY